MCIESWKQIHPDFEIKRWDESNSDLSHPFVIEAIKNKKWAFVADFVRFQVLKNEGGIYMDTDMLLLKPLTELLNKQGFLGFEDNIHVSAGIIGAVPNQEIISQVCAYYQTLSFNQNNPLLINSALNHVFENNGLTRYNVTQEVGGFLMFEEEIFYPYTFLQSQKDKNFTKYITENAIAVHLWDHSWGDEFSEFRKGNTLKGIQKTAIKVLKKPNQPLSYYKKVVKNALKSNALNNKK